MRPFAFVKNPEFQTLDSMWLRMINTTIDNSEVTYTVDDPLLHPCKKHSLRESRWHIGLGFGRQ